MSPSDGNKMMDAQAGFAGGLNTVNDPAALRPDQARQLTNCVLTTVGAATRRPGTQRLTAAASSADSLGLAYWPRYGFLYQAASGLTSVFQLNLSSAYFGQYTVTSGTPPTWTTIALGATLGNNVSIQATPFFDATGAEHMYFGGVNGVIKISSAGVATPVASAAGAGQLGGVEVYNQRLWAYQLAGNSIYYSDINNGDTLGTTASGGGQIIVTTFNVPRIQTIKALGSSLIIFNTVGISRLTGWGQDDITVQPQGLDPSVAIVGATAVCDAENVLFAMTSDGLAEITETSVRLIATPEKPDPVLAAIRVNPTSFVSLVYLRDQQSILVAVSGYGTWTYNRRLDAWSGPWTGAFLTSGWPQFLSVRDLQLGNYNVLISWSGNNYVSRIVPGGFLDYVTAAGTGGSAYTMTIQCHRMFAGDRQYAKAWRWIRAMAANIDTDSKPVVSSFALIGGTSTITFGAVTGSGQYQQIYYLQPGGVGPYLDVTITDAGSTGSNYETVAVEGSFLGQR